MLEIGFFVALLVIAASMLIYAVYVKRNPMIKMIADEGDEDIRIADGNFGDPMSNEDYADKAAEEYLRQKDAGNIELAGHLGELLAEEIWSVSQEIIMNDDYSDQDVHQRVLLLSYAVNSFIADSAPNNLLGETALSVFYNSIEELSSVLYKHVSDTASFSLYILNQRAEKTTQEAGRIYAKLSGMENSPAKILEGNELYLSFYMRCKKIYDSKISYNL